MADPVKAAWSHARRQWHPIEVSEVAFRARLASLEASGDPCDLATDDLYLAIACGRGDDEALRAFERAIFGELDVVLRKLRCHDLRDDVGQQLRVKLFVAGSRGRPAIDDYRGQGSLRRWFRMVATRTALNLRRGKQEQLVDDDFLVDLIGAGGVTDPELEMVKHRYREQFRRAYAASFAGLDDRDQQLVRLAFRERMSVDEIGGLFDVHRATAARWVAKAHHRLMRRTRERLVDELGITPSEFESVFKLIVSRLELTLERYTS